MESITAPKESLITPINEHWTTSGTNQLQIDDLAATEYLAQMSEVDELRIGCAGWSMGGYFYLLKRKSLIQNDLQIQGLTIEQLFHLIDGDFTLDVSASQAVQIL